MEAKSKENQQVPSSVRPNYQLIEGRVVDVNSPAKNQKPLPQNVALSAIKLMRLDRPVGILLLLMPTLAALWLAAKGTPPLPILAIFVLGVVLTRSAGCVINDYADRWLDRSVERTQNRVLVSGALSGRTALILFAVLMLAAFGLVLQTNATTIWLSVLALVVATIYPYCKRHTYYPQVVLGIAFSMGIPMAYTALGKTPDATAWLLFCGNCLWTLAYDTLYAMVDRDDDLLAGSKSTAILFGELDIAAVAILHASAILSFALIGSRAELTWPYYAALGICAALVALQVKLALKREKSAYFQAFKLNQWFGIAMFSGVLLGL
jgi:4-hydroxybenzoate polyprenyltransferase